jgi:hypothetical protein
MMSDPDEPSSFESRLPAGNFSGRCARCHATEEETSVGVGQAEASRAMPGEVESSEVDDFLEGLMLGVGRHIN